MDRQYAEQVLAKLKRVRDVHDEKFSDNPRHRDCLPRIDNTIEKIEAELGEEPRPRLDFSVSETALPDALEPAARLQAKASELEKEQDPQATPLREQ